MTFLLPCDFEQFRPLIAPAAVGDGGVPVRQDEAVARGAIAETAMTNARSPSAKVPLGRVHEL